MKINYKDLFWMGLGLFLILLVIYRRTILERLPQEIIFEVTFWKIFTLLWLVLLYFFKANAFSGIFLIYLEAKENSSKIGLFDKISKILQKPYTILFEKVLLWKHAHYFFLTCCTKNIRIFTYLKSKIGFLESYEIPYIILNLMPRTIVMLALSYDIYNQYFNYFYKTLILLFLPMFYTLLMRLSNKHFINKLNLLKDKFDFLNINDLTYKGLNEWLYDINVHFEYHEWFKEEIKNCLLFFISSLLVYKIVLFQHLYFEQLKYETRV